MTLKMDQQRVKLVFKFHQKGLEKCLLYTVLYLTDFYCRWIQKYAYMKWHNIPALYLV
jgi:hypothetical protein